MTMGTEALIERALDAASYAANGEFLRELAAALKRPRRSTR
jgi:hypothetical protein